MQASYRYVARHVCLHMACVYVVARHVCLHVACLHVYNIQQYLTSTCVALYMYMWWYTCGVICHHIDIQCDTCLHIDIQCDTCLHIDHIDISQISSATPVSFACWHIHTDWSMYTCGNVVRYSSMWCIKRHDIYTWYLYIPHSMRNASRL